MRVPSFCQRSKTVNQSGAVVGGTARAGENYSRTRAAFDRVTICYGCHLSPLQVSPCLRASTWQQTPQVPRHVPVIPSPFPPWVVTPIWAASLLQQVLGRSAVIPWFSITAPGLAAGVWGFGCWVFFLIYFIFYFIFMGYF